VTTRDPGLQKLSLLRGCRKFGDQAKRNGKLVQLEVRTKESNGPIAARLAGNFSYINARLAERTPGLHGG
jgi:hypothetical protein